MFHAIPLRGVGKDRPLLAILLVGNSRRQYVELRAADSRCGVAGGRSRNYSGDSAEQLGGGASDTSGGTIGAGGAGCSGGKLEFAGRSSGPR